MSTPEQLRKAADDLDAGSALQNALYPLREPHYHTGFVSYAVALSLRIEALLLEQESGAIEFNYTWTNQEKLARFDAALAALVRQHASGRETGEGTDG